MDYLFVVDTAVFRWLNSWAGISDFWDWAIVFRARYLWYVMIAAALAFAVTPFVFPRLRHAAGRNLRLLVYAAIAAVASRFVITELIRFFYNRPRPFEALPDVIQLVPHAGGGSFPSGHAALVFAVAAAAAFYYPKASILFFLAALSIGIGRIAAGLHWPSDIVGGAAVGIITSIAVQKLLRRYSIPPPPFSQGTEESKG